MHELFKTINPLHDQPIISREINLIIGFKPNKSSVTNKLNLFRLISMIFIFMYHEI